MPDGHNVYVCNGHDLTLSWEVETGAGEKILFMEFNFKVSHWGSQTGLECCQRLTSLIQAILVTTGVVVQSENVKVILAKNRGWNTV